MVLRSSSHIIRPDVVCGVDDAMVMAVSYMYSVPSHLLCWRLFITQLLGNQSHQVKCFAMPSDENPGLRGLNSLWSSSSICYPRIQLSEQKLGGIPLLVVVVAQVTSLKCHILTFKSERMEGTGRHHPAGYIK